MKPMFALACLLVAFVASLSGCAGPASTPDGADQKVPSSGPAGNDETLAPETVSGGAGEGGGQVINADPTVESLSASNTLGDNGGSFEVIFTAQLRDANGQNDIASLAITSSGAGTVSLTHSVTASERAAANEPATWTAGGWKVWGGTPGDGIIEAKVRYTFPAFAQSGDYDFTFTVTDTQGATGSSAPIRVTVTSFSLVEVAATPFFHNGTLDSDSSWGEWTGAPGATNVASRNYIKIVNSGDVADASVVVDFTESSFAGTTNQAETVPIDTNLQFAWWEDTTPETTAPEEGVYAFATTASQGSTTVTFSSQGNVIWVTYRVVALPSILSQQTYGASFTVTEL